MLVVIAGHVLLRDLGLRQHFCVVENDVLELALFWDRVDVGLFVAIVKCFQFGVGGMKGFKNVILFHDRVIELYLGVLFFELLADFGVSYCGA